MKKYNFTKLLNEELTGYEAELHTELKKNNKNGRGYLLPTSLFTFGLADNIEDVGTKVSPIETIKDMPLYRKIGCTVHDGLISKMSIPNIAIDDAQLVAEGAAAPADTNTTGGVTLSPNRYSLTKEWSKEYVSVSANFENILRLMFEACERALTKQLLKLAATNILTGRNFDDVLADVTWADITSLYGALNSSVSDDGAFVLAHTVNGKLMGTPKNTSAAIFISDGKSIAGMPAFGTGLTEYTTDLIFGNWRFAHVGLFEATEVIANPYTKASSGKVEVTLNLIADVKIGLTDAFKSIRNAQS